MGRAPDQKVLDRDDRRDATIVDEALATVAWRGRPTGSALHDRDEVASLCDEVSMLHGGRIVVSGPPGDMLTVDHIRDVFGVRAHLGTHPLTGRPHIAVAPLEPTTSQESR